MIGLLLTMSGTLLDEISLSIGKWKINNSQENIYTYGFLNIFWAFIFFSVIVLINGNFVFSKASIPLFLILAFLEILQTYSSLHAIAEADRSAFAFILTLTIPLVLTADYFLGYQLSTTTLIGVCFIVFGIIVLLVNHGINKKGIKYVIFSTINASITISIYKYLITYYNSVEAQQILTNLVLMIVILALAYKAGENPFRLMFKKGYFLQSFLVGVAGVPLGFAYLFAPASVIISVKRGSGLMWSIISGRTYFKENHIILKLISCAFVLIGFFMLAL